MHIVLVTTSYPDSQSGSEAAGGFVEDFARQLAKHARVSVVAATASSSSVRDDGAIRVHRFMVRRWPLSLLRPHNPADWRAIVATLRDGRQTLRDVVENDRPDYILALWALPSGYWARSMLKRYGVPYGVWALGSDIWSLGRIPLLREYLRIVLKGASRCYADGLQLGATVEKLSGKSCEFLPSTRILPKVAHSPVAEGPPYRLAFLGRWHPNKGVDIFLESLLRLSPDGWAGISEVRVHGGGPLEAQVYELVDQLKAAGCPIEAGGYLDAAAAAELIAWCDYLVLPSRVESIPVVFSDAAQLGRPLIATPVGDLPRLFQQNEFGILAAEPSVAAFADAIRKAIIARPIKFQTDLAAVAGQFDIEAIAGQFAATISRETTG